MATNPTITLPRINMGVNPLLPAGTGTTTPRTPFFNPTPISRGQYMSGPVDFYSQTLDTTGVGVTSTPGLDEDEDKDKSTEESEGQGDQPPSVLEYTLGEGLSNTFGVVNYGLDDINFGPDSNNTYNFTNVPGMTMDTATGRVARDLNSSWSDSLVDHVETLYEGAKAGFQATKSQIMGIGEDGKARKDRSVLDKITDLLGTPSGVRPYGTTPSTVSPGGAIGLAAGPVIGGLATAFGGMNLANQARNAAAYKATGGTGGAIMEVGGQMVSRMPGASNFPGEFGGKVDSFLGELKDPISGVALNRNYLGGMHFVYSGNMRGLSHQQMAAREAASYGFVPGTLIETYDPASKRYVKASAIRKNQYMSTNDMENRVGGTYNPKTGTFVDLNGNSSAMGTRKAAEAYVAGINNAFGKNVLNWSDVSRGRAAARARGIDFVDYMEELAVSRGGNAARAKAIMGDINQVTGGVRQRGSVSFIPSNLSKSQIREIKNQYGDALQDVTKSGRPAGFTQYGKDTGYGGYEDDDDSFVPSGVPVSSRDDTTGAGMNEGQGGGSYDGQGDNVGESTDPAGSAPDNEAFSLADGGRVGMQQGGPAGFAQRPEFVGGNETPTNRQSIADNVPREVPEGTFVINAAAVDFAGREDIEKMVREAYAKAGDLGQTGVSQEIDIAVSEGEVIIPPHIAKIIGYDRLNKINNRGKKEISRRQAERQKKEAAGGGFISRKKFHRGGEAHSHDAKAAIGVSDVTSKYGITSDDKEIDDLQKEQYTRKSLTPTFKSKAEEELYNKGIQFGDTEVFADILGKTNFNKLIQAAARDSRTLSDTVTTLRPGEDMANPYHRDAMGLYSQYGQEPYTSPVYEDGFINYTETKANKEASLGNKDFRSDVSNSAILVRSPTEFGGPSTDYVRPPMAYIGTLAHELMHRGADVLRNDPNFNPTRSLVAMQKLYAELPSMNKYIDGTIDYETYSKARDEKRTISGAEHRYIAAVVGQAYLKRNIESVSGAFEKSQKPPKGFEDSFGKVTDSDLVNEAKQNILYETRRVFEAYLTPENRTQFFKENSLFKLDPEYDSLDLKIGKIYHREDVNEIPFEKIAAAYDSINRIMAEDYATILFKNAVVDKPVNIPRRKNPPKQQQTKPLQDEKGAAIGSQPAPEQKYERGFLDKMLGVTPAY